jgi:hypothetical protein
MTLDLTSNDPTFESKGDFQAIVLDRTNAKVYMGESQLSYSKPPPKHWVKKEDWICKEKVWSQTFNSPTKNKNKWAGAYPYLTVKDRSSAHVAEGYAYIFYSDTNIAFSSGMPNRFCFRLTGVAGGSVVLPGFGLYGIGGKPEEWSYIWPNNFQGGWGIQVLSDAFATPYSMSVQYKPLQDSQFTQPSALIFSWEGATFSEFDESEVGPPEPVLPHCVDILADPKAYVITNSLD